MRIGDGLEAFRELFPKVKARFDARASSSNLVCKQGFYKNCSVLKLQKPSWTNDPIDQVQNRSGIFFSIWINKKLANNNRANYNIHALKLRELKGYSITSRDFATEFRSKFATAVWPNVNVRVDYGPLTLMQGWVEVEPATFEKNSLALMECFEGLSPLIDRLLESRSKVSSC